MVLDACLRRHDGIRTFYRFIKIDSMVNLTLNGPEAFIGKAPEGEGVVLYFDPSVTPHMEASGPPGG